MALTNYPGGRRLSVRVGPGARGAPGTLAREDEQELKSVADLIRELSHTSAAILRKWLPMDNGQISRVAD